MKLLHVISSVNPQGGGPIEGVKQLHSAVSKNVNATVEIACLDSPSDPFIADFPFVIHPLGPAFLDFKFSFRLISWLRENAKNYDAVVVNGLWQFHSFAAYRALSDSGVPYYVFTHGMLDPWFKVTFPLKHLKKLIYWFLAEKWVLQSANKVIFTCEEERLLARESFPFYKVNESVTHYGTDTPPQEREQLSNLFLSTFPECSGKRLVLFLSRIHKKKGCDLLVEAFASIAKSDKDLHLVMAGPDQVGWGRELKNLAEKLGIQDRITWAGMLQGDLKWGAYHACEVFALPSHQENFGIVVAEALGCGKPVLLSNKVNIWREIVAEGAGFVSTDTLSGTIENFNSWLSMEPNEYSLMCTKAFNCFSKNFHIGMARERLFDIINGAE